MARFYSGRNTTRELLFDDQPFAWVTGDEFTDEALFPDEIEEERAVSPGFISRADELSIDPKKKRTKEEVLAEQRIREAGEILLLVEHPWYASEVAIEELADPDFFDPFDGPPELLHIPSTHDLAQYRRVESANGKVALLPRHA